MARLKFVYASMNSGKSLNLITKRYALIEKGFGVVTIKPAIDTRSNLIETRVGLTAECVLVPTTVMPSEVVLSALSARPDFVLIDEAQFLSREQIEDIRLLVDNWNIDVIAYGLKLNWLGDFFEGSLNLFRLADELEAIENLCPVNRGQPAFFHIKTLTGNDADIEIGREEVFTSVSRKEWYRWAGTNGVLK